MKRYKRSYLYGAWRHAKLLRDGLRNGQQPKSEVRCQMLEVRSMDGDLPRKHERHEEDLALPGTMDEERFTKTRIGRPAHDRTVPTTPWVPYNQGKSLRRPQSEGKEHPSCSFCRRRRTCSCPGDITCREFAAG
jgi:hypothetical protein